ncbi:hypothetical protein DDN40_16915 [Vibrio cholerae]|nr:hypothetical protein [Vibrio cholerae]
MTVPLEAFVRAKLLLIQRTDNLNIYKLFSLPLSHQKLHLAQMKLVRMCAFCILGKAHPQHLSTAIFVLSNLYFQM